MHNVIHSYIHWKKSNFTISGHRDKSELDAKVNITNFFTAGWLMHFKLSSGFYVLHMRGEIPPLEKEAAKSSRTNFMGEIKSVFTGMSSQSCWGGPVLKVTCRFLTCCISNELAGIKQEPWQCVLSVQAGSAVCSWLLSQEEKPESLQDAEEQCQFITTVRRLAAWAGILSLIVISTVVVWKQQ